MKLKNLVVIFGLLLLIGTANAINLTVTYPTEGGEYQYAVRTIGTTDISANITYEFDSNTTVYTACTNCTAFGNTTTLSEGAHNVTIVAVNYTNSSDNATSVINFTIDNTAPTITVTSPVTGHKYFTRRITFTGVAADTNTISSCTYSINGGTAVSWTPAGDTTTIEGVEDSNTLTLTCTDLAGNSVTSTVTFEIYLAEQSIYICGDHICSPQELAERKIQKPVTTTIPHMDITTPSPAIPFIDTTISLPVIGTIPALTLVLLPLGLGVVYIYSSK